MLPKTQFRTQPQFPVEIDRSKSFADGLFRCSVANSPFDLSWSKARGSVLTRGALVPSTNNKIGLSTSTDFPLIYPSGSEVLLSTPKLTFLFSVVMPAAGQVTAGLFRPATNSPNFFDCAWSGTAGAFHPRVRLGSPGEVTFFTTPTRYLQANTEYVLALRIVNGVYLDIWWQGVQQLYTATTFSFNSLNQSGFGSVQSGGVHYPVRELQGMWIWDRELSDGELSALTQNPWQMFRPAQSTKQFFISLDTAITGTLNVTEADDTLSSTGALAIAGSLSVTEASDSVSSTGALAIAGSLSVTEDSDTVSSTGTLALAGSLTVTEASDTLASTGALSISGSLSVTEEGDTLSSTGSSATTGSLNVTEESDALSSTGALAIAGSLAVTEESDTLSATGTLSISGSLSVTEEDDALASTGSLAISGSLAVTEDSDTLASAGTSGGVGSLNVTEEGDTLTATATVTQLVGGGGMGKQKRQRGWANERARLEASLKTETAAQEVKTATKILRASDSESARRVADLVREYESARATLEQLRDEVERLRVETDRSERLRDEVETAAKVVEIFAQEEAELLEILDIIDEMESRALLAALGIAA